MFTSRVSDVCHMHHDRVCRICEKGTVTYLCHKSVHLISAEPFSLTMTSFTESCNAFQYTPFYENKQNEREILQRKLLECIVVSVTYMHNLGCTPPK